MLNDQLLSCLQCPLTAEPLQRAGAALVDAANRAVDAALLLQNDGELVDREVEAAVVSNDWMYIVDANGAHLVADEAISLQQPALKDAIKDV